MNLMSYNIRGGGISSKRKRISFLIQSYKLEVCFIQETKISCFNEILTSSFWGSKEVEWTMSNSLVAPRRG